MSQTPYYGGDHHPPPLFVAELDGQPGRPSDAPSHHGPDGTPVFEMASEPVLAKQPQTHTAGEDHSNPSNEWPAPLKSLAFSISQRETKDEPSKDASVTSQPVMANPWAYFGPESPESKFKETQTENRRPSEPVYKPYPGSSETCPPQVPQSTRPAANVSTPDLTSGDNTFYPAPLKLAHRPAKPASPPAFKPYAPPEPQDTSDLLPKPLSRPYRANPQSPTTPSSYQPYRPHSPRPPVYATPASDSRPATTSPLQSAPLASPPGVTQQQPDPASHHFHSTASPIQSVNLPATEPNLPSQPSSSLPTSPKPQPEPQPQKQHGIPNAAPAKPVPSTTHLPSPMTPSFQQALVVAPSPATPAPSTGVPFSQPQYTAHVAVPSYSQISAPSASSSSPAVPNNPGLPFAQPQYAAPVQAHDHGSCQPSVTPSTTASTGVSSPEYSSSQLFPTQPSYGIPQPIYASAPASSTPGGVNPSSQYSPAVYQQVVHTGPTAHQSHTQQPTAESYGTPKPTQIPQSPPPPYAPQDTGPGVGANHPASSNHMMYQPSPVGAYPPQPQYPTQPSYAPATSPPLQGLQPPALPPRPSSSQGFAPSSGFGSGPTGYNPSNYPPPPHTYFSPPPPALPARPGLGKLAGGGGKIFGSSSADKWLRKTGQVLESTLAPYLQGQSGSYRQGSHGPQGQQGQTVQQAPGPYLHQGQYFHAPHLAPQFRGAPESGPPQHGPGAPAGAPGY